MEQKYVPVFELILEKRCYHLSYCLGCSCLLLLEIMIDFPKVY